MAMIDMETGDITGTKDKEFNLIWFTETCLSNALRLEIYVKDAEREGDTELAEFFRKAQHESKKGAEQAKALLKARLS
jgi:rubrerythrin